MSVKPSLALLSIVSILILISVACTGSYDESDQELDNIKKYAAAQVNIERLRKQVPTDWDEIAAQYAVTSPFVKEMDKKMSLTYHNDIMDATRRCKAGEDVKINQQVLAKGLQHVTVLFIRQQLQAIARAKNGEREKYARRTAAFFEGIRPTVTRRDKDFFAAHNVLEQTANQALQRLTGEVTGDLIIAARDLEDTIIRTYALSVLYEILQIEKLRDTDSNACHVKLKEAVIFYRIIQPTLKRRNPKSDELISAMLKSRFPQMNAGLLEENLKAGLRGIALM